MLHIVFLVAKTGDKMNSYLRDKMEKQIIESRFFLVRLLLFVVPVLFEYMVILGNCSRCDHGGSSL